MIKKLSYCISIYLKNHSTILKDNDFLKINYVIQVILRAIIILFVLFIVFGIIDKLQVFILALIILISLRPYLGGIHCKSAISCTLLTLIHFLLIVLLSGKMPLYNNYIYVIVFLISFILVLIYAPLPNKKRHVENLMKLKIKSLISLSLWIIIFFYIKNSYFRNTIFLSILLQIIQIIIINRDEHN